jgi:hypothetical protein
MESDMQSRESVPFARRLAEVSAYWMQVLLSPPQRGLDPQIPGLRLPLFPRAIGARRRPAPANPGVLEPWRAVFSSEP